MSDIALLRAADLQATPLKSGDGTTATIALFPEDARIDAFEWRMSVASMAAEGAFSYFGGIDRKFGVLSGAIELDMENGERVSCATASAPIAFPGERAIVGRPLGARVTVLNVMVRRDLWSSTLQLLAPGHHDALPKADTLALVATGSTTVECGGKAWSLGSADTLIVRRPTAVACRVIGAPVYCASCTSLTRDR